MAIILYAGLNAKFLDKKEKHPFDHFHLTLMYGELKATPRFYLGEHGMRGHGTNVEDIVYWEHVDLTVAIINHTKYLQDRFDFYSKELGIEYDYEFVPHVTLGKGNLVEEHAYLKGTDVDFSDEYIRFLEK